MIGNSLLQFVNSMRERKRTRLAPKDSALCFSLGLNVLLSLTIVYLMVLTGTTRSESSVPKGNEMVWHGGYPTKGRSGSCWCGQEDQYCMCTPNVAIDVVVSVGPKSEYLWLVRRRDTNQLATMGGFVEINETAEQAVARELQEEMGITLRTPPTLLGVYSDPRRDNRRRTVSIIYVVKLDADSKPRAGDDVKEVKVISIDDIEQYEYFSDHRTVLLDYRRFVRGEAPRESTEGDFSHDILRSTCAQTIHNKVE